METDVQCFQEAQLLYGPGCASIFTLVAFTSESDLIERQLR